MGGGFRDDRKVRFVAVLRSFVFLKKAQIIGHRLKFGENICALIGNPKNILIHLYRKILKKCYDFEYFYKMFLFIIYSISGMVCNFYLFE